MNKTRGWLEDYHNRTGLGGEHLRATQDGTEASADLRSPPAPRSKGKKQPGQTAPGVMNKTEERFYNEILWPRLAAREIIETRFEEEKFKLGHRLFYTPDFAVVWDEGLDRKKCYMEIKGGFIRDKGIVKFKAAAAKFSEYSWQLWQYKVNEGWRLVHDL